MGVGFVSRGLAVVVFLGSAGAAHAACYDARQQLPAQTVSAFMTNPAQLLTQFPNGGAQLISQIRDLTASDPATLPAIVGLLASANNDQQSAIGSGLGQAYRICLRPDQAFATQVQQAIAASPSNAAKDSYALVNPDVPIGVAGGAGGGGGGGGAGGTGVGGPTGGSFGSTGSGGVASAFGTNATANSSTSSLTGGTAGGASGLSRASSSVSPQ